MQEYTEEEIAEVRKELRELKELVKRKKLGVVEVKNEIEDREVDRLYELKREEAFKDGLSFPFAPGVKFKGQDAVNILDEMYGIKKEKPPETVVVPLSDEEYQDLAMKHFRVDVSEKPKKKHPFNLEEVDEGDS